MDPAIHVVAMGGEAAKSQDIDDGMEIYCEEDIDENKMAVGALVLKFRLPFIYICTKKCISTINIIDM